MTQARARHTATLLANGKVLVAGGWGASGPVQASAELYDPTIGTWTATGNMTMRRFGETATLLRNGKVLVAGGRGIGSTRRAYLGLSSAELYDPATGSWSRTGSMDAHFSDHTATLMADGKVLIAGGGAAALYDPEKGTWRATGKMIESRYYHTATLLRDGRVLVAGGGCCVDGHYLVSAELYDPTTGTWSAARDMLRGRVYHNATLLRDGTVLVTGGWKGRRGNAWEAPAFDELYDPANGRWTATGNMHAVRGGGLTDTLLPDGTVLAAGGTPRERLLASAELYDAGSGIWAATVKMHEPRAYQTATLLLDGTVLVAGGYGRTDGNSEMASAELYDPGSGS